MLSIISLMNIADTLTPLPFKGRIGVGMDQLSNGEKPIPILAFPLKGKGRSRIAKGINF
jgi:hypothetical protein